MTFKYLGIWFDSKGTWEGHIRYLIKKCQQRINFLRTITGSWWGAHPSDVIRLYQTTILLVMEYGCFCFRSAANTHIIKLERIQYRCLRIALGSMQSTHTMSLEVLAGVLPLKDRFWDHSSRLLIRCEVMNPLVIENFERLVELQSQTRFMTVYFNHISQEITPSSYVLTCVNILDTPDSTLFLNTSMQEEIRGIPEHLRSLEIPKIFISKYQHIDCHKMFYTDGSRINEATGFGIFNSNTSISFKLAEPASVYTAELAAVHYSLEIIDTLLPSHYFILTDSLSTIKALRSLPLDNHAPFFLKKIREYLTKLTNKSYQITLLWIPAHCSIPGNERADNLAKIGALDGDIYERPVAFNGFYSASRQRTLTSWQTSWDNGDLGRWLHSIIPKVSTKAWFKGLDVSRNFIRVMSRLLPNHYTLNAHLRRIGIAEDNQCACGKGYEDIEHIVWSCTEYRESRSQLIDFLRARRKPPYVPVRDILVLRDLTYMGHIYHFLKTINIQI
ncbi:uncharacterized protein LOC131678307 [Topomyia yanbarensis]|uniref:uncharacterized protein LOC131678307 n=1 Tax=Topomyia yanbarensis TaxID=2498891 RepID=UPI00273BAB96|nr:uncharacterized protein LOC131678307 [Topomyia yanbarensis]